MKEGSGRKKNPIILSKLGIICISIIIIMNIIGVGYGSWQNRVEFQSTINTGSIDPVFVECEIKEENKHKGRGYRGSNEFITEISGEENSPEAINDEVESLEGESYEDMCEETSYVEISDDRKHINIFIKDAYPGYSAKIRYKIENQGTIPITCKVSCDTVDYITVDVEEPEGIIYGFGDYREGVINIELEKGIQKVIKQYRGESGKKKGGTEEEGMEGLNEEWEEENEEPEDYGFTVDLTFRQYNVSD